MRVCFVVVRYYLFRCFYFIFVFIAAPGLSLVAARGDSSRVAVRRLLVAAAPRCRARTPGARAPRAGLRPQARGFGSCGPQLGPRARARQLVHELSCSETWVLPRPGIQPMSLALAGGFLPTEPSGKPQFFLFLNRKLHLKRIYD